MAGDPKVDLLNITDLEGGWMVGIVGITFFLFDLLVFAIISIVVHLILYFMYRLCSRSERKQCMVFNTIYFNYSVI